MNGEQRFVEVVKAPVIDDRGDVIGVFGLFTDITRGTDRTGAAVPRGLPAPGDRRKSGYHLCEGRGRPLPHGQSGDGGRLRRHGRGYDWEVGNVDYHANKEEWERHEREEREVIKTEQDKVIPEIAFVDANGRQRWFQTMKKPLRRRRRESEPRARSDD